MPVTLEGQIVKICDRIAYVNHDIDDAIRSGILSMDDLPDEAISIIGTTHSDRINNLIVDLCTYSEGRDSISLSPEFNEALLELRSFMFRNVYGSAAVLKVADIEKVELIITSLYNHFLSHPEEIPGVYREIEREDGTQVAVKDLISGMTDRYAMRMYDKLFVPHGWR